MDAREILGIPLNAGEEEIRAAYVQKVKEHPPDRSPEEFEKIRDAYETLRDPRRRMRDMLLSANPEVSLTSLTYEAIRFGQGERFASVEDPNAVCLPKPCTVA